MSRKGPRKPLPKGIKKEGKQGEKAKRSEKTGRAVLELRRDQSARSKAKGQGMLGHD